MLNFKFTYQQTPTFLTLLPLLKLRLHNKTWRLFRRNNFIFQFGDRIAIFQTTRFLQGCPSPLTHPSPLAIALTVKVRLRATICRVHLALLRMQSSEHA